MGTGAQTSVEGYSSNADTQRTRKQDTESVIFLKSDKGTDLVYKSAAASGDPSMYDTLTIEDERRSLENIHNKVPGNAVKPHPSSVKDSNGKPIGYVMEAIEPEFFLYEPAEDDRPMTETEDIYASRDKLADLTEELVDVIYTLHHGERGNHTFSRYHGDLYHNVAVIEDDDDGLKPCLLDPAGESPYLEEKTAQKNRDLESLEDLADAYLDGTDCIEDRFPMNAYSHRISATTRTSVD